MKPIFRSAMFGFHKGDVFNFITKQNKQYESKIAELNTELEKAKEEFEEERQAFDRDMTELEQLRTEIEQKKMMIASLSSCIADIINDNSKILSCAATLQSEQSEIEAKFSEMQLRVNEAEHLRAKAEKFDQLSGVLSSIFNQPEISKQETIAPAENGEPITLNSDTVSNLVSLLEVLSARCEKLQNQLSSEKTDD